MIRARNVRQLIKEAGPQYKAKLRELLGVQMGNYPEGSFPVRVDTSKAQVSADEFSIRDLAEEFLGSDYLGSLHNPKTSQSAMVGLREALNPVLPSAFQDINAFNQTIGGLIETRVLAGYQLPEFIASDVCETMPTRVNGGKIIGIPNIKAPIGFTKPGEEMPTVGMQERWAIAQANKKYAAKLELARETVVYDLTGELLGAAEGIGKTLALGKEVMVACAVLGITLGGTENTGGNGTSTMLPAGYNGVTYIYDGNPSDTPNDTYQSSAGTGTSAKYNYVNLLTTNTLVDWKNLQTVRAQLNLQREYETTFPISADLDDVFVSPQVLWNARAVLHGTSIFPVTGGGSTNFPTSLTMAPLPSESKNVRLLTSNIWNKLLVDNGFAQANADALWYGGNFKKAFIWREVWPLNVLQANPSSSEMIATDTVNMWACSWYGTPAVRDPRYVICNGFNVNSPS